MARLERPEITEHVEGGLLHEIARIEMASRRGRQTPMRPAFQGRKAALKDCFDSRLIAGARTYFLDSWWTMTSRSARST